MMQDPLPAVQDRPALQDRPAPHVAELHAQPASAEPYRALPLRNDTILGVCEAIGQEFGFHPNYLRVVFAAAVLWNPVVPIAIYLAIGTFVALARSLYPRPEVASVVVAEKDDQPALAAPANADSKSECLAA
jgi:phage shock protein PspC (stress-responsive transcriptional regulator)